MSATRRDTRTESALTGAQGRAIAQAITNIAQAIVLLDNIAVPPPNPLDLWRLTEGEQLISLHRQLSTKIAAALRAGRSAAS